MAEVWHSVVGAGPRRTQRWASVVKVIHNAMPLVSGVLKGHLVIHVAGYYRVIWLARKIIHIVASELKDPICHSDECQIGSFSSEATIWYVRYLGIYSWLINEGICQSVKWQIQSFNPTYQYQDTLNPMYSRGLNCWTADFSVYPLEKVIHCVQILWSSLIQRSNTCCDVWYYDVILIWSSIQQVIQSSVMS